MVSCSYPGYGQVASSHYCTEGVKESYNVFYRFGTGHCDGRS